MFSKKTIRLFLLLKICFNLALMKMASSAGSHYRTAIYSDSLISSPPSQILRRLHHVRQCRAVSGQPRVFRPQSGLTHRRSAECVLPLSSARLQSILRSVRLRVNVIDARTDFIWIIKLFKHSSNSMSEREVSMVMTSASSPQSNP